MIIAGHSDIPKDAEAQGEALYRAIIEAIERVARKHNRKGELLYVNAIVSALITSMAYHLAAIPDDDERRTAFAEIGIHLLTQTNNARKSGSHPVLEEKATLQ
jgi:hypothetical protein